MLCGKEIKSIKIRELSRAVKRLSLKKMPVWAKVSGSIPIVEMETDGLKTGDVAGLALLNLPYTWLGIRRNADGLKLMQNNQITDKTESKSFKGKRIWLCAKCDFLTEKAKFSFSADGKKFEPFGG